MPGKAFFNSNVLIYVLAKHDPRSVVAEALLDVGGVVSVQVLNEFAAVGRRKLAMSWREMTAALAGIAILCPNPVPLTVVTHQAAVTIAARYDYQFYDALIVAAALQTECDLLYTEDMHDGHVIDRRLTIRNPFNA